MPSMDRRSLLKLAAASGLTGSSAVRLLAQAAPPSQNPSDIHTVLLIAKCHLDIGFTETQARVLRRYFDLYFPEAIKVSAQQRAIGEEHYTWTTCSWLLYEYLEQASPVQRKAIEQAIAARDLAWHAAAFNWQTEMIDRSTIDGSMGFSRTLDQRFGVTTIAAKMTDVPGHSRGLVAPFSQAGVRMLDIGVNAASTPPDVPDLFLWTEPSGQSIVMMYHRHDYGGIVEIPKTGYAVDVEVRNDNSGPHTPAEISGIYARLRSRYPNAVIKAASLNDVARVTETIRTALPVVTSEIGDTWIYGCASDPEKIAHYRSIARLRTQWIAQQRFVSGDSTDRNLLRRLLLAAEHTWGTDTKTYLDNDHYRPADLATVSDEPGYIVMKTSWQEKRKDILDGIACLPARLRRDALSALSTCAATVPDATGMHPHPIAEPIETTHVRLRLDPATGAIVGLKNRHANIEWASLEHPLALFTYQTLSSEQYSAYIKRYLTVEADWGPKDFGKPGIAAFKAVAREWHPRVVRCLRSDAGGSPKVLLELAIDDLAAQKTGNVAWPNTMYLELTFPAAEARVDLRLVTLGKAG